MPNHVTNFVEISGADAEKVYELLTKDHPEYEGEFAVTFEKIAPMPDDIERGDLSLEKQRETRGRNWYDWSVANWGTKWDAYGDQSAYFGNDGTATLTFQTAWSAPRPIYELILQHDVSVVWHYLDEGDGRIHHL